jgi:hypothetical protein
MKAHSKLERLFLEFENETLLIQNHLGLTPDPCGIFMELWRLSLTFES